MAKMSIVVDFPAEYDYDCDYDFRDLFIWIYGVKETLEEQGEITHFVIEGLPTTKVLVSKDKE